MKKYDEIFFNMGEAEIRVSICKERVGYDTEELWRSISHSHNTFEFHYITEGSVELTIQNSSKINKNYCSTNFTLAQGDICIISPDVYHNTVHNSDKQGKKLSFNFEIVNSDTLCKYFDFTQGFHIFRDLPVKYYIQSFVNDTLKSIHSYGDSKRKSYLMFIFSEMTEALLNGENSCERNCCQYTYELQRKNIIDEFFDLSVRKEMKLDDLAIRLCLSPKQASRVLKEETGMGFQELLEQKRINYGEMLLKETNLTIERISEMVQYGTSSGFIRAFKKATGKTPNRYRKEIKGNSKNEF